MSEQPPEYTGPDYSDEREPMPLSDAVEDVMDHVTARDSAEARFNLAREQHAKLMAARDRGERVTLEQLAQANADLHQASEELRSFDQP